MIPTEAELMRQIRYCERKARVLKQENGRVREGRKPRTWAQLEEAVLRSMPKEASRAATE